MRVLLHDFSGHPFQASLARHLGMLGHEVLHVHCSSYRTGTGSFEAATNTSYVALSMRDEFARYSPPKRLVQELGYGVRFARMAREFQPDVLVSCNEPLVAKLVSGVWCARQNLPWAFWLQDLYSVAIARQLDTSRAVGRGLVTRAATSIERWLLRSADEVISITPDFAPILDDWGIDSAKVTIIENWAPVEELPLRPRDNAWRRRLGVGRAPLLLYSGTLGLKHDPLALYDLAEHVQGSGAHVVVISEGIGAKALVEALARHALPNLHLLPFQPYEHLPDILAMSDVLLVLLEPHAGVFSVPSKVLTALCAGRPILGMIPTANLAARTIRDSGAGVVVEPGDKGGLFAAADTLLAEVTLRRTMGEAARRFAERTFDGQLIVQRFETVLTAAARGHQYFVPAEPTVGRERISVDKEA